MDYLLDANEDSPKERRGRRKVAWTGRNQRIFFLSGGTEGVPDDALTGRLGAVKIEEI